MQSVNINNLKININELSADSEKLGELLEALQENTQLVNDKLIDFEKVTTDNFEINKKGIEDLNNLSSSIKVTFEETQDRNLDSIQRSIDELHNELNDLRISLDSRSSGIVSDLEKQDFNIKLLLESAEREKIEFASKLREIQDDSSVLKAEGIEFKNTLATYQEMLDSKLSMSEHSTLVGNLREEIVSTNDKFDGLYSKTKSDIDNLYSETPKSVQKSLDIFKTEFQEDISQWSENITEINKKLEPMETQIYRLEVDLNDSSLKHSGGLQELRNTSQDMILALRNDYDGKIRELSNTLEKHGEGVEISNNFIMSSQEMFNTLSISNAKHDTRIQELEAFTNSFDNKLSSLESADLFLQEAHRMLTERTTSVEAESRKVINKVNVSLEDHKEDIEAKLKSQINLILKDIEDMNEERSKSDDAIDRIDELCEENKANIEEINQSLLKQSQDFTDSVKATVLEFKRTSSSDMEVLERKIDENRSSIESNTVRIKNSAGSIHTIMDNLTTHTERLDGIDTRITDTSNFVSELSAITNIHTEKLSALENSIDNIESTHVETVEKLNEVTVLATNIEVHVKNQIEEQKIANIEKVNIEREKLQRSLSDLQNGCEHIQSRLQKAEADFETDRKANDKKFGSLLSITTSSDDNIQEILQRLGLYDESNKLQAQKIHMVEMLSDRLGTTEDELREVMIRLRNMDDENLYNKEKLVSIEEAYHMQSEKAVHVESLMNRIDEARQQSEAKSKEDMEQTVSTNAKAIEHLTMDINSRIARILEDFKIELESIRTAQSQITNNIKEENEKTIASLENDQESKLVTIMKIIEDHRSLIEKTHTSVTTITERIVEKESEQNNSHESFIAENGAKISRLQENLEKQITQVAYRNSEQQAMIETNCSEVENLKRELAGSLDGVHYSIEKIQNAHESEKQLVVSRMKEERDSLDTIFNSLENRVELIQTIQTKESSRLEKFEKHIIEKSQGDEALLKRVVGLENTANAHQNMMLEIEKASADRSQEIEMELDDYRKSNKEDLRSIRLGRRKGASGGSKVSKWLSRKGRSLNCCTSAPRPQSSQNFYLETTATSIDSIHGITHYRNPDEL